MLETTMKNSEVLNRTADVIEEHGWGFGSESFMGEKGLCVEGALHLVLAGELPSSFHYNESDLYYYIERTPAARALAAYVGVGPHLYQWNDEKRWKRLDGDRMAFPNPDAGQEVVEAIRACALIEEAKENGTYTEPEPTQQFVETITIPVTFCGSGITLDVQMMKINFADAISGDDVFQSA